MKKNVMMRIACFLLVAVLISTSTISGTYAKYVTEGTGSDSARVAKFGVAVTANGDLFLTAYAKEDAKYNKSANSVETSDTWKVIAPGTTHSMTEVQLTGTPEVAVRVSYKADLSLAGWSVAGAEYCPIIFTVDGHTYGMTGSTAEYAFDSIAVLELAVEQAIEAHVQDYEPNTNLANIDLADPVSVSWVWPFSTSHENDLKDTALGDAAASGYPAGITLTVTTTVTQID